MTSNPASIVRRLALISAIGLAALSPAHAGELDGKSFEGVFLAKGKTSGDADRISFANGRFRSSACDKYGYSDAVYKTVAEGGAIRFEAETESAKYGKLRWTGWVRGDKLDATAMMIRDGKAPVENWVAASLKR